MGKSKREIAIEILRKYDCMLNSCLNEDDLKHFNVYQYLSITMVVGNMLPVKRKVEKLVMNRVLIEWRDLRKLM